MKAEDLVVIRKADIVGAIADLISDSQRSEHLDEQIVSLDFSKVLTKIRDSSKPLTGFLEDAYRHGEKFDSKMYDYLNQEIQW